MADFESIIKSHAGEDGSIPAEAIAKLCKAINTAVGNEFVDKARYKAKLDEIDTLKTDKQTAEDSAATAEKWKTKYEAVKNDFDAYKSSQTAKETHAAKEAAYREALKAAGVSEKRIATIIKASGDVVDALELVDGGKIKDADKVSESIKAEWGDFITTTTESGTNFATPPATQAKNYTPADIRKMTPAEINANFDAIKASLRGEN